jgi:hypothetical protein
LCLFEKNAPIYRKNACILPNSYPKQRKTGLKQI